MKDSNEVSLCELKPKLDAACHYVYSVWLFTASDISTTIIPATLFALFTATALENSILQANTLSTFAPRILLSTLWVWMNLLLGVIGNQRQPLAIEEDRINKPWRTMPSGRMTIQQAATLERILYASVVIVALRIGGIYESLSLIVLGIWYNKLGGADRHWFERNIINVFGFTSFNSGALQVLLSSDVTAYNALRSWILIVGGVVLTTVQIQDLRDQAGDAFRNRSTMPLDLGDMPTRWFSAVCVLIWTGYVPWFWGLNMLSSLPVFICGITVALRTLIYRQAIADQLTFTLWTVWLMILYATPAMKPLASNFKLDIQPTG